MRTSRTALHVAAALVLLGAFAHVAHGGSPCNTTLVSDTGYLQCTNGNLTCPELSEVCACRTGWTGRTCSLCADDSVCARGVPCQPVFAVGVAREGRDKTLECDVVDEFTRSQLGGGFSTIVCDVSGSSCTLDIFDASAHVFRCALSACSQRESQRNSLTRCTRTSCSCSGDCSDTLRALLANMRTAATIDCDRFTGQCFIAQAELSLVVEAKCDARECLRYTAPTVVDPVAIVGLSIFGLYLAVAVVVGAVYLCLGRFRALVAASRRRTTSGERGGATGAASSRAAFWARSCLTVRELTFSVLGHRVLTSVSAAFASGTLSAVLGASGAGKTTLLDLLADRRTSGLRLRGTIEFNGVSIARNSLYTADCAYVLQDDNMHGALTVREHLVFAAELRMPSSTPAHERTLRVGELLEQLGLAEVADSLVGDESARGISGGQRKRLAIAVELVAAPKVLLLDEPTSGLDAAAALVVMQTLRAIAKSTNTTVVCSLHQPRSAIFDLLDSTLVLAPHGVAVYFGPARELAGRCSEVAYPCPDGFNTADHVLDLIARGPELVDSLAEANTRRVARALRAVVREGDESEEPSRAAAAAGKAATAATDAARDGAHADTHDAMQLDRVRSLLGNAPMDKLGLAPVMPRAGQSATGPSLPREPRAGAARAGSDWGSADSGEGRPARVALEDQQQTPSDRDASDENCNDERLVQPARGTRASFWRQLHTLVYRDALLLIRERTLLRMHVLVIVVSSFLLGLVFLNIRSDLSGVQDRSGLFFFIVAMLAFSGVSAVDTFHRGRSIFVRERSNGDYSPLAYFVSKTLIDLFPLRVLPVLLLATIVYFMAGLRLDAASVFFRFLLVTLLTSTTAASCALLVSVVVSGAGSASLTAVLVVLAQMLFGGFLASMNRMPAAISWIHWLSFFRYAFEALMVNEIAGTKVLFNPRGFAPLLLNGDVILDNLSLDPGSFARNVGVLAGMTGAYLVCALWLLISGVRERR